MSTKISENTNIQLDLKTVIGIIMVTASFVGMYYTLQADIEEAKPQKKPHVLTDKKVASVSMLKTNKKLAPKVPNNDEWESF